MNLNQLLRQRLHPPTKAVVFALIVALLGFADAAYLTIEHYQGKIPPCSIVSGCETVLTSSYSMVAGVPVSLGGAIYYVIVLIGLLIFLESKHLSANIQSHHFAILKWTFAFTAVGFLSSLWFLYVQAFILNAYCLYCLGSALTSTVLFIIAVWSFSKHSVKSDEVLIFSQ